MVALLSISISLGFCYSSTEARLQLDTLRIRLHDFLVNSIFYFEVFLRGLIDEDRFASREAAKMVEGCL